MSPRRSEGGDGRGGHSALTVLLVALVAFVLLLIVRARPSVEPFDPRSERSDGTRGLVLLLEDEGATVDVTRDVPTPGTDARVLVLSDRLGAEQRIAVLDFVEAGGVAVVADPTSSLHGGPGTDGGSREFEASSPAGTFADDAAGQANLVTEPCTIAALQHLRGVRVSSALLFPVAPDEPHCFGDGVDDEHAFVVGRRLGDGIVIGFGDNRLLTNGQLRYADNSGLATALLAPRDGARVVVLVGDEAPPSPTSIGSGEQTLRDLVRPGVWMALGELALAFVVLAVARGVRAGRHVAEPLPSPLAGSDFVRARGRLMHRARHAAAAGEVLRVDLHRELCASLRLPAASSVDQVARTLADRHGVPYDLTVAALAGHTDRADELQALAQRQAELRARLAGTGPAAPDAPDHDPIRPEGALR